MGQISSNGFIEATKCFPAKLPVEKQKNSNLLREK